MGVCMHRYQVALSGCSVPKTNESRRRSPHAAVRGHLLLYHQAAEKAAELAAHGAAGTGDGIAAGASVTSGAWAGSGGGAAEPSAPKRSSAGTEWGR